MVNRIVIIVLSIIMLIGCTMFSNQTELMSRVRRETRLEEMKLTVRHESFLEAGWECAELHGIPWWFHPVIVQIYGCATTRVQSGIVVECNIILGTSSKYIYEHELNHCRGYAD